MANSYNFRSAPEPKDSANDFGLRNRQEPSSGDDLYLNTQPEIPLIVIEIAQMLLSRLGFGHWLLSDCLSLGLINITHSLNCISTFWTLQTPNETITLHPDQKEAAFCRNGEQGTFLPWTSSQELHELLTAMLDTPAIPPMTPAVHDDPLPCYQNAAVSSLHTAPGELNFVPSVAENSTVVSVGTDPIVAVDEIQEPEKYACRIEGCNHMSSSPSNRTIHEASKKHKLPGHICPEVSCAIKTKVEKKRSGTRCLPECEGNPCGGLACLKAFPQKWNLERHISEGHTLVPLRGCPVVGCEVKAVRPGKCDMHGTKMMMLEKAPRIASRV